jgi:hypothetical protein
MIHVPTFIVSLSIGVLLVYLFEPKKHVIYVLPTPDNENDIQYKDLTGTCFAFKSKEVRCPSDGSVIKKYSVQHQKESP